MAEASGYVVLILPVELSEDILQCEDDEVPLQLVCSLLESAGLNANLYCHKVTSITDSTEYMEMDLSGGLGLEEKAEYIGGYTVLRVWGGDWIALSHILANNSKSLEIYAKIRDDDGFLFLNGRIDGHLSQFFLRHKLVIDGDPDGLFNHGNEFLRADPLAPFRQGR